MEHIWDLISVIGAMLITIALGYVVARLGVLTEQGRKSITELIIDLVFPCYVINGFINNIGLLGGEEMLFILGLGILVQSSILLLNRFLFRWAPKERQAVLRYGTVVSNSAFLGLPLVGSVFGSEGLICASIYVIPLRVNTFGVAINYFHPREEGGWWRQMKATLSQPSIAATLVGIVIMLAGWRPPEWMGSVISSVAACSTPLSMLMIGAVIYAYSKQMRVGPLTVWFTLLRLVILPGVVFLLFRLAGFGRVLVGTAVLLTAMPAGTTVALLADKYGKDVSFAGELVLVSTLCSMVTLPIWSYLCLYA